MEGQAHVDERPGEGAAEHRDGQDVRPREPQRGLTRNPSVERSSVCRSSQIPARDATPGRKRSSHCRPPSTPLGGPGSPLTRLLKGSPRVLSGTYPMVSPSSPTYCGLGAWETTMSRWIRSEEHTSELQSRLHLVCRLLLEKKKKKMNKNTKYY